MKSLGVLLFFSLFISFFKQLIYLIYIYIILFYFNKGYFKEKVKYFCLSQNEWNEQFFLSHTSEKLVLPNETV